MNLLVLDYESYFDRRDYSLSRMTTESYIRDPRFEAHGCAIKTAADKPAFWVPRPYLKQAFATIDWADTFVVAHHNHFDGLISSHHYGVVPRMYGCTLSMARLILGNHLSVSLEAVRQHFGMPTKQTPYGLFEGKHWDELSPAVQRMVGEGAVDEVESVWKIFHLLLKKVPIEELEIIDSTIRMFTNPVLLGDGQVFSDVWKAEQVRREQTFARLGIDPADLQSADRFAELLRGLDVEPEKKLGKPNADGSEKPIYAFAKTDPFMEALQLDEDPDVRALAEARLGAKSTLLGTRAETMGWMASRGPLCIYLNYCGAHTTRWSGGDSTNFQNWTNGSDINKGVSAPEGWLIVEPDSSQIECRLLNFIAGQWDKIEEFRSGADPYVGNASVFYKRPINKYDHPMERQLGKIVELQAGYQSGGEAIRRTVRVKSGGKIILTPEEGMQARDAYRETHRAVVALWDEAALNIKRMSNWLTFDWGPMLVKCDVEKETRRIVLPNGCELVYDSLNWHVDEESGERYWRIKTRKGWTKIYGGKLVENCLSANTKVLTRRGWRAIVTVSANDLVWDGVEWVGHGGFAFRGVRETAPLNGVRMTADHEVLTKNGWVRAALSKGHIRAEVQLPYSRPRRWFNWKKAVVAVSVRLWNRDYDHGIRFHKTVVSKLRLPKDQYDPSFAATSRIEPPPAICSLVVDVRSMPTENPPSVQKLRRAWHYGVSPLAEKIRKFLGRYVPYIQTRSDAGASQKQQGVLKSELRLGNVPPAGQESSIKQNHRNTVGADDGVRGCGTFGRWGVYDSLSSQQRVAKREVVRETRLYEPVFDLVNCGPRHRFVVLGDDGPFIVHNCIQALARVVISQAMIRLKYLGYRAVNTKHDSLWLLVPEDGRLEEHKAVISREMNRTPDWLPGIPLASEFKHIGRRYA